MRNFLEQYEKIKEEMTRIWELKIGIHTGPVAAASFR